jgi:hypothetical protein
MNELIELAERCACAGGPDRGLDTAIVLAIYGQDEDMLASVQRGSFNPTASFDDAMTLVLPYLTPTVIGHDREVRLLNGIGLKVGGDDYCSHACTLTLALCAAALRARAASPVT